MRVAISRVHAPFAAGVIGASWILAGCATATPPSAPAEAATESPGAVAEAPGTVAETPGTVAETPGTVAEAPEIQRKPLGEADPRILVIEAMVKRLRSDPKEAQLDLQFAAEERERVRKQNQVESEENPPIPYRWKSRPIDTERVEIRARVVACDGDIDVHLISIGSKGGLKPWDELTIYRGDAFVAQVVVDRVFTDKASVRVMKLLGKSMKKSEIKVGDKVQTTL